MFSSLYRVLVKQDGKANFQGTGRTDGGITIEPNVIHQMFYAKEDALRLCEELNRAGFETKIERGN